MDLSLNFDYSSKSPLYKAVSDAIRAAILGGQLKPGQTLPSVRHLANAYNISPATVIRAYEQLASQGLVETLAKSRTRVMPGLTIESSERPGQPFNQVIRHDLPMSHYLENIHYAYKIGEPHGTANLYCSDPAELPVMLWEKMLIRHRRCYQTIKEFSDIASNRFGYVKLRESIANYLMRARALQCSPEQIIITNGSRLDFFCRLILNSGDYVGIENPSYPTARTIFASYQAQIKSFEIDANGLILAPLLSSAVPFKVLHISPTHNEPKGTMLSQERRMTLLGWAQKNNTIIFESDFDSVYRYAGQPIPSLSALSKNDIVFYSSSFWMCLGPLISLGFIVIPNAYISLFEQALKLIHFDINPLEQCALAEFIDEGHLERFLHRTSRAYSRKRQALIHHLTMLLGNRINVAKETGSKHLLVRFNSDYPEELILKSGELADLPISSTRPYYMHSAPSSEFMIPFASLTIDSIPAKVSEFSRLLEFEN